MNQTNPSLKTQTILDQADRIKFLVFDLDGVITSEQKYWNTARLTVWELITQPEYLGLTDYFGPTQPQQVLTNGQQTINNDFIYELKRRAINSNWDLTYFVFCLHLAGILQQLQHQAPEKWSSLNAQLDLANSEQWQLLSQCLQDFKFDPNVSESTIAQFWQETTDLKGSAVTDFVRPFYQKHLGISLPETHSDLWNLCYQNFQAWYEGRKGFTLPDDETVLDVDQIKTILQTLKDADRFTLAIATGRPRNEVIEPLTALGLLPFFDPKRIVTYDEVLAAEEQLKATSGPVKLGKPHPFVILKALHVDEDPQRFCTEAFQKQERTYAVYIGDAASDVVAAQRSGCISVGVLTGFTASRAKAEQVQMFTNLGCDRVIESIQALPQVLGIKPTCP
ncbi:HAD family hydrolase [Acaryochloris sp. CCMEE 5410]|uniref:HAD family hydrolase n=1 Tax=Acaryochloris sp. CCMEE 5410 TaxID=310037 RepID=UPI0002483B8A|nr:HAD hydrolase-like protein [Acaryochloris sp. CCMEE 5410]KAI9132413.1 HAD family hydrolase [Acaryochloris sp. CCMEE 5410]